MQHIDYKFTIIPIVFAMLRIWSLVLSSLSYNYTGHGSKNEEIPLYVILVLTVSVQGELVNYNRLLGHHKHF